MKTRDQIMDIAETYIREVGYNAFSFREIADDIGIKSASVHYHFPSKADLGEAVAKRYLDRMMAALGDPASAETPPDSLIKGYIDIFRKALKEDKKMCLCGMLAAEHKSLPPNITQATLDFFAENQVWLTKVFARTNGGLTHKQAEAKALHLIATMEGAIIISRTIGDDEVFETIAEQSLNQRAIAS